PCLTVCVIVGGVTAGEVWRLSLVLVNMLFFSLSVTILTSTFCRQQRAAQGGALLRSEEHTSELQSPCNLVCRLLLEKKNYRAGTSSRVCLVCPATIAGESFDQFSSLSLSLRTRVSFFCGGLVLLMPLDPPV